MKGKYPKKSIKFDPKQMGGSPFVLEIQYLGNDLWIYKFYVSDKESELFKQSEFSSKKLFEVLKEEEENDNECLGWFIDYIEEHLSVEEKNVVSFNMIYGEKKKLEDFTLTKEDVNVILKYKNSLEYLLKNDIPKLKKILLNEYLKTGEKIKYPGGGYFKKDSDPILSKILNKLDNLNKIGFIVVDK
jgi:hypothetical protein